jgi:hypothetical protein
MSHIIKFSVHRDPQTDQSAQPTYHVRQDNYCTADKGELMESVRLHSAMRPEHLEMALSVLEKEIADFLLTNRRLHIDGLGTFYLKLGFREQTDEYGQPVKAHFTDPAAITGHDVKIDTIGFRPDLSFLKRLSTDIGTGFENMTGRGHVGHSAHYTDKQFMQRLDSYLKEHRYVTRHRLIDDFGLSDYMARKWLDRLTTSPMNRLRMEKMGNTLTYWPNE